MIVVVGTPAWRPTLPAGPAGRTCEIAVVAAAAGAHPEIVARIGDDPAGDALVIALSGAGVGHAAVLRDPAGATATIAVPSVAHPEADEGSSDDGEAFDPFAAPDEAAQPAGPLAHDGPRLQRADVALGLSYLTAFSVLVVSDDVSPDVIPACLDGAAFSGAHLVVLVPDGAPVPSGLPSAATVLSVPAREDGGAVARIVGRYAAAVDAGQDPAAAFRAATAAAGWDPAGDAGTG